MKDQKLLNETKCMFEYSLQTYVGTKPKFVNVSQLSFFFVSFVLNYWM